MVRELFQVGQFIEVFINAPLAVCESRDVKGLYAKARSGLIENFTGVSAPYEAPLNPEIVLRTDMQTAEESVQQVLDYLKI
jgi:adenylylsulfate kinase-like enzyme